MFEDPENTQKLMKTLKYISNMQDLILFVNNIFPNWIYQILDGYSQDYPHLQKNWLSIATLSRTNPKKIIIVEQITYDSEHKILCSVVESLTLSGYVVRTKEDLIACTCCYKAIPTEKIFRILKNNNLLHPNTWSDKCSTCQ